jgi:purine-binding chemotaxis protein CheW
MVDSIGEVISLPISKIIPTPENLPKSWKDVSMGIYPVKNNLIVIVNIDKLLQVIDGDTESTTEGEKK